MLSIDFWYNTLETNPEQHQQDWQILDHNEKAQAEKFKTPLLQARYVTAHGQLRAILAQYLNQSPASLRLQKTALGKPYLVDYAELTFNLSHTGNVMAVAVARNCQLGVDIEQCKPRETLAALVKKCFRVEEADYWQQLSATEQQRQFYQFWTRKEAFVKATGFGIALGLKDCVLNPENPQTFLSVPANCGLAAQWHSRDIDLGENLCAAVVADKAIASIIVHERHEKHEKSH